MSSPDRVPPSDDTLVRAENALRHAPVAEGPSQETLARTLAALSAAARIESSIFFQRKKFMWTILKIGGARSGWPPAVPRISRAPPMPATAAFVAAAQQLRDAHSLSFRMSSQLDGAPFPKVMQIRYKDPGLVRYDMEPHGDVLSP